MKYIAYLCLAAGFFAAATTQAQSKKKKSVKAAKLVPATTQQHTRIVSDSEYSYAKGVTHTEGLGYYLESQYKVYDEHRPKVAEGIRSYYATAPEQQTATLAHAAGMEAGVMTRTEMLPHFNKIITGQADSTYIDAKAFAEGYMAQSTQQARYTTEQARQIVARQDQYMRLMKAKVAYDEMQAQQAQHKDLKALEGGVLYRIIKAGKGARPTATSQVKVHYEGRLTNGKVFDSSYERGEPITFGTNQVIAGWGTALQAMPVGSTWEVIIPQELAYGERGAGQDIPPYSNLVFKIELLSIESSK